MQLREQKIILQRLHLSHIFCPSYKRKPFSGIRIEKDSAQS